MKTSNKGKVAVVENTSVEAVVNTSFEKAFAAIPANEHRTFNEADFAKIADLSFPADYAGVVELVKALGPNEIFALATKSGKKEVERVSKLFFDNAKNLRSSAVQGLKSASGKSAKFAGSLTYAILSFKKNS